MAPVMTFGVAPGASIACTLSMDAESTTLSEFVDDGDQAADAAAELSPADGPTPAENAADIARLVDLMQDLTDQVASLVDDREQRPETDRTETEPHDAAERMFQ
jgi:hypothetical protein